MGRRKRPAPAPEPVPVPIPSGQDAKLIGKAPGSFFLRFNSVEESIQRARNVLPGFIAEHKYLTADPHWTGRRYDSQEPAALIDAALKPWAPDLQTYREFREAVDREIPDVYAECITRKRCLSEDTGQDFDVDRLMAGEPDFWVDYKRAQRRSFRGRMVRILVHTGGNCAKRPEQIFWRGVAAIALTDILEEAGYRVTLEAVLPIADLTRPGHDYLAVTNLKLPEMPVNVERILCGVSAWFFRTVGFVNFWCNSETQLTGNLGRYRALESMNPAEKQELEMEGQELLIDQMWTKEQAVQFIRESLQVFRD